MKREAVEVLLKENSFCGNVLEMILTSLSVAAIFRILFDMNPQNTSIKIQKEIKAMIFLCSAIILTIVLFCIKIHVAGFPPFEKVTAHKYELVVKFASGMVFIVLPIFAINLLVCAFYLMRWLKWLKRENQSSS